MNASSAGVPTTYEIKSATLPLVALWLKSSDLSLLRTELNAHFGDTPDFFDQDPLVVDLAHLPEGSATPDFKALVALLRRYRLCPLAAKGGTPDQMKAALAAGLVAAPDVVMPRAPKPAEAPEPEAAPHPSPSVSEPPAALPALVVDKPLRSGQQVYARGRDLVVLAMVNAGAEVIADGHIHVYAPLRGKAIAGARGQTDARIFALAMEPELISIAGVYRTSETPLPPDVAGKAAMVSLHSDESGDKLVMEALKG